MKNPKLMLLRSGRRYRVVAVGCAYQGPYKGLIILPGQPRAGWQLAQAERWAENWDESKLLDYVGNKVGSYVYPHRRSSLYELGFKAEGGNPRQRPVAERDPRAPIYIRRRTHPWWRPWLPPMWLPPMWLQNLHPSRSICPPVLAPLG